MFVAYLLDSGLVPWFLFVYRCKITNKSGIGKEKEQKITSKKGKGAFSWVSCAYFVCLHVSSWGFRAYFVCLRGVFSWVFRVFSCVFAAKQRLFFATKISRKSCEKQERVFLWSPLVHWVLVRPIVCLFPVNIEL